MTILHYLPPSFSPDLRSGLGTIYTLVKGVHIHAAFPFAHFSLVQPSNTKLNIDFR